MTCLSGKESRFFRINSDSRLLAASLLCFAVLMMLVALTPRNASAVGNQPQDEPAGATIFGEGVISTGDYELNTTFTPDGKTIYFTKATPDFGFWTIVSSRFENGKWAAPEVAPFSGQYSDSDPFISPDGAKLYFVSNRPSVGATPRRDFDIWMVDKTPSGWGEPQNLGAPVNTDNIEFSPAVTSTGVLYFSSNRSGGKGDFDLYRCRLVNNKCNEVENLGDAINTRGREVREYVSPNEELLIFTAAGRQDGQGGTDLYVSTRKDGAWLPARNLGSKVNSPALELSPAISPDGKYLFFTSTRGYGSADQHDQRLTYKNLVETLRGPRNSLGDIYRIDIAVLGIKP